MGGSYSGYARREDIRGGRAERAITLSSTNAMLVQMEGAISIIISSEEKGWNWVRNLLSNKFIFRSEFVLILLGTERALLFTKDEIARQELVATAVLFHEGVKVCITPWKREMRHSMEE